MGLITDVCLKRKVRNYVQTARKCADGFDIFIKEKAVLNSLIDEAHEDDSVKNVSKAGDKTEAARKVMCARYYDVRTFGAVMSTGKNAGQVRGPIQLTFARSVEPIIVSEHSITRMAVATDKEAEKQGGDNRTMGRKATVPYGLYVCHGFVSSNLAHQTGFDEADLELFWEALRNMFECDRSAARGLMSARKLYVFSHATELGNAPASSLFDRVKIVRKDPESVARSFADYEVSVDTAGLAEKHIEVFELIDGIF
jgi:CRISPR-associated protein Csd2